MPRLLLKPKPAFEGIDNLITDCLLISLLPWTRGEILNSKDVCWCFSEVSYTICQELSEGAPLGVSAFEMVGVLFQPRLWDPHPIDWISNSGWTPKNWIWSKIPKCFILRAHVCNAGRLWWSPERCFTISNIHLFVMIIVLICIWDCKLPKV